MMKRVAVLVAVVLVLAPLAFAQAPPAPADLVLEQLAALRAHDFAAAYAHASAELRRHFSPGEFEWMVKRAHPEVASSSSALVLRTREADGYVYVTVRVEGRNGRSAEALYELVRERDGWKVNAVSSRPADGLL